MTRRFVTDPKRTARRVRRLRRYTDAEVFGDHGFVCTSADECRASVFNKKAGASCCYWEGQLSYVGRHYDVSERGLPLRVLIIAMDTGRPPAHVTLGDRRSQVATSAGKAYSSRNPHMRGTTSALRVVFGGKPGADRDGEHLNVGGSRPVHVFDAYAMANLRLCSATDGTSSRSVGTKTMSRNCLRHLAATITILEPTVCIAQGINVRKRLEPILDVETTVSSQLSQVRLAGQSCLLASFTHPSVPNGWQHWGRLTSVPYLTDVVVPTLRLARTRLSRA
jgi:hypothetical protein